MPKVKIFMSLVVVLLAVALVGGATMAWFTAKAELDNSFTAGTVLIEADAMFEIGAAKFNNVNPGDCYRVCWKIKNVGSKAIELRVDGKGLWTYDWDWIEANWEALCFSGVIGDDEEYDSFDAFRAAHEGQEPPMGSMLNPVFVIPDPDSSDQWAVAMVDADGNLIDYPDGLGDLYAYHIYYLGGPIQPGEEIELCLFIVFDGDLMGNIFQGATFEIGGTAEAIQWSNDAPSQLWGADVWNAVQNAEASQLIDAGGSFAHPYFIGYDFDRCITCENGNGPPNGEECQEETAWGGDNPVNVGEPGQWWYFYNTGGRVTQDVYAGQYLNIGEVTVINQNGYVNIVITLEGGWELQPGAQTVKIQGTDEPPDDALPKPVGLFDHKGNSLTVNNIPVHEFYLIHLDVQKCE